MTDPSLRIPTVPQVGLGGMGFPELPSRAARRRENIQRRKAGMARAGAYGAMMQGQNIDSGYGAPANPDITPKERGWVSKFFGALDDATSPFASLGMYAADDISGDNLASIFRSFGVPSGLSTFLSTVPPIQGPITMAGRLVSQDPTFSERHPSSYDILSGVGFAGSPSEASKEDQRIAETGRILQEYENGSIDLGEAWKQLGDVQQSRPTMMQLASGALYDPINLIPVGWAAKPVRSGVRGLLNTRKNMQGGSVTAPSTLLEDVSADGFVYSPTKLSTSSEAMRVMHSPETGEFAGKNIMNWMLKNPTTRKWIGETFAPNGVLDWRNPSLRTASFILYYMSNAMSAAHIDAAWLFRNGIVPRQMGVGGTNLSNPSKFGNFTDPFLDSSQIRRKESISLSRIQEGAIRPGGQRIALPGERLRSIMPDLFRKNRDGSPVVSLDDVVRMAGGGQPGELDSQILGRFAGYQHRARRDALQSIIDGSAAKRRNILEHWGVKDPIRGNIDNLSNSQLDEILENPEILRRIDNELAQILDTPSNSLKWLAENGYVRNGVTRAGTKVGDVKFLNADDSDTIFDKISDYATMEDEINLGAMNHIEIKGGQVHRGSFGYSSQRDKIYLEEVMQNPELFDMTPEMRLFIDDFASLINQSAARLVDMGAMSKQGFLNAVPGQYSSALWKIIDNTANGSNVQGTITKLPARGPELLGKAKDVEFSRIRDYVSDNLDRGYRGGSVEEQVFHTLRMLKQIEAEKIIMDVSGAWTRDLKKRIAKGGRIFSDDLLNTKKLPKGVLEEINKVLNPNTSDFVKNFADVNAASRALTAGFDFGAPFIHGLPLFFTDGAAWGRSTGNAFKAMKDPETSYKYIYDNMEYFRELHRNNGISINDAEYVEALTSGGLLNKAFTKLTEQDATSILGNGTQRLGKGASALAAKFGAHFNMFLISSKVEMYKGLRPAALQHAREMAIRKAGKDRILVNSPEFANYLAKEETEALAALSEHTSKVLGVLDTANTGLKPSRQKLIAAFAMFAPRYRMSIYALMADVLRGRGTYRGRMARDRMKNMMTSATLWYSYLAYNLDQEPQLNPLKGGFMSIKIGNTEHGIGSAYKASMRFMANLAAMPAGTFMESADIDPEAPWLQDIKDNHTLKNLSSFSSDNDMFQFLRSQISPLSGATMDMVTGRTYMGEPIREEHVDYASIKKLGMNYVMPFWMSGALSFPREAHGKGWISEFKDADSIRDPLGTVFGAAKAGLSEAAGLQAYSESPYDKALDLAQEQINILLEDGRLKATGNVDPTWNDLNGAQKAMVLKAAELGPAIEAQFDLGRDLWSSRGAPVEREIKEFYIQTRTISNKQWDEVEEASAQFGRGITGIDSMTGEDYRNKISDIFKKYRAQRDALEDSLSKDATELREERKDRAKNDKERTDLYDEAYYDWIDTVIATDFTKPDGSFDYKGREAAQSKWNITWTGSIDTDEANSHPVAQYVQSYHSRRWPKELQDLRIGQNDMRPYWDVPKSVMASVGWDSEDMLNIYEKYQEADGMFKEQFKLIYPWISEVDSATREARQMMRMSNSKLDHFMIKWGYASKPMHPELENIDPTVIANAPMDGRIWK